MKRSKEIPPASVEPWNTDTTEPVEPVATPPADEDPADYPGVAEAPTVEMAPVTDDAAPVSYTHLTLPTKRIV